MRGAWLLVGVLACDHGGASTQPTSPTPATPEPTPTEIAAVQRIEGKLRVDAQPGGKGFQGVWLDRAEGEPYVLAYRPVPWLAGLAGRTVRVTGEVYVPPGQAIMATHFRVDTLAVLGEESEVPVIGFGPETAMSGEFVRAYPPKGAKNDDQWFWTFVTSDGAQYLVEHMPDGVGEGTRVQVHARAVEPSRTHMARRGGDWLWVLDWAPPDTTR